MSVTRRDFCRATVGAGLLLGVASVNGPFMSMAEAANAPATYLNPVLGGDHPDADAEAELHNLKERIESRQGLRQLSYMKEMKMGNDRYELIAV